MVNIQAGQPLLTIAVLLSLCVPLPRTHAAGVRVFPQRDCVILRNSLVEVQYDLTRGEYLARSRANPRDDLRKAHLAVNQFRSNEPDTRHTWRAERVVDALGQGRRLLITCTKAGRPDLLLGLTLYERRPFLVLEGGLKNTGAQPIPITYFAPLADGAAFDDLPEKTRVKFLNGSSGAQDTLVTDGAVRPIRQQSARHVHCRRPAPLVGARRPDLS